MNYIILAVLFIAAIVFSFLVGWNIAIKAKAKQMIEKMNMGMIIFDLRDGAEETFQCSFEKSPREMLDKEFVLMEVKIRR